MEVFEYVPALKHLGPLEYLQIAAWLNSGPETLFTKMYKHVLHEEAVLNSVSMPQEMD